MEAQIAGVIAILSLFITLSFVVRCLALTQRLNAVENVLREVANKALPNSNVAPASSPLEGLRIAVSVKQDHEHPIFANLLKDLLLKEDVGEVVFLTLEERDEWKQMEIAADILISGDITCNGYAEVYYTADFRCDTREQAICTLIEKPPHGDRQGNLAIELVARLKTELERHTSRDERRKAIQELRGS